MKKNSVLFLLTLLALNPQIALNQDIWWPGTADDVYKTNEGMAGIEFVDRLTIDVKDQALLAERLQKGCLMITLLSVDGKKLIQGCYGNDPVNGEIKRVGGIPVETIYTDVKSHQSDIYTSMELPDEVQTGPWQLPGARLILLDDRFRVMDTISIDRDQEFWDDRYPIRWAPTVYDTHSWGAGKLNDEVFVFAIIVYRDFINTTPEGPHENLINIQRQAIVAYHYDAALERSVIFDIMELDQHWDPSVLYPGNDPHHTNEMDVTFLSGKLYVTFGNRGPGNSYKVPFTAQGFGETDYILGGTFATDGTVLPFIGNGNAQLPLNLHHGAEYIQDPLNKDIDYMYAYNNGDINEPAQQLSYSALIVVGDTTVIDAGTHLVNHAVSGAPVYSMCCGGLEEVLRTDPFQPILAMERGMSGIRMPNNGVFIPLMQDNMFEPLYSLQIPPPFSGSNQWKPLADIYGPDGFGVFTAANGIFTILYDDLPEARTTPCHYWYEDGMTHVSHDGVYLWELDGAQVSPEPVVAISGILTESDLQARLRAFVRDSTYMWPVVGGFVHQVATSEILVDDPSGEWKAYPNPVRDVLQVSGQVTGSLYYGIFTVDGRLVKNGMIEAGTVSGIDVRGLKPGQHLLRISAEGQAQAGAIPFVKM